METPTAAKAKREIPVDLIPIDGLMQAQFAAQSAPPEVLEAWSNFVIAVAEWKEPKSNGG